MNKGMKLDMADKLYCVFITITSALVFSYAILGGL